MSSEIEKFKTEIRQTFPNDNLEASLRNDAGCMDLGGCIWTMVDTAIVEDILIGPNCKARVHYDLVICEIASDPTNIILQFNFDNFEAYPIDGECDSIINSWLNLYQMDDTITLENDIRDFNYFVSEILEQQVIDDFLFDQQWSHWFGCSSFNPLLFAEFSLVECSQLWIRFVVEQGHPVYYRPIFSDCGDFCCTRNTLYCVTSSGDLYQSNEVFTQSGDCDAFPTPPGKGYYPIGDCQNECGEQ